MSPSRRTLLAGLAALPAAPLPTAAATAFVADRIGPAIERHRAAMVAVWTEPDDSDKVTAALAEAEHAAMSGLLAARPTTWTAFTRLAVCLHEHIARSGDVDEATRCLATLAEASRQLVNSM